MKAKEYYEKYQSVIVVGLKGKKVDKIQELVAELYNETIQLIGNSKSHADWNLQATVPEIRSHCGTV